MLLLLLLLLPKPPQQQRRARQREAAESLEGAPFFVFEGKKKLSTFLEGEAWKKNKFPKFFFLSFLFALFFF
jgi:hypothetical protein